MLASASTDGIKVWDLRSDSKTPVYKFNNAKKSNFISLDYSEEAKLLAAGTELGGVDAELHIWDLNKPDEVQSEILNVWINRWLR
ncbi:hypothetical protein QCA50_018229 [Cerrena zonata]|uniref:Uncharacterized protein n=1 Tax=Cerrena zonata TaxID=2478898 RepID=A0AAW0FGX2_9APHY